MHAKVTCASIWYEADFGCSICRGILCEVSFERFHLFGDVCRFHTYFIVMYPDPFKRLFTNRDELGVKVSCRMPPNWVQATVLRCDVRVDQSEDWQSEEIALASTGEIKINMSKFENVSLGLF